MKRLLFFLCLLLWQSANGMTLYYANNIVPLARRLQTEAFTTYDHLNAHADYFNPTLIKDHTFQQTALSQEHARKVYFRTDDGLSIEGYFFDRHAKRALIVGQGCHAVKEKLLPFLKLFPDYDILFLDYRWLQWQKTWCSFLAIIGNTLEKYLISPQLDATAAVTFLRTQKHYESVSGLGICYSGMIFCGAQERSLRERGVRLFDSIIIDCSMYSMEALAETVCADPLLIKNHREGGTPWPIRWVLSTWPVRMVVSLVGHMVLGRNFSQLTMASYLQKLQDTPLLFIQALDDKLVPIEYFWRMYKDMPKKTSCVLFVQAKHAWNHLTHKEWYAYMVDHFIKARSCENFVHQISNN